MAIVEQHENRAMRRAKARMQLEGSPTDAAEVPGWTGRIMVWLRVAAQLVVIQLLMGLGTLAGLVLVGFGPSAVAGASLLRRVVDGDPSDSLWKEFWAIYRAQFRRAAAVTAPMLLVIGLAWYEVLLLLINAGGTWTAILTGAVMAIGAYGIACLMYAPHILRRYTDPAWPTLRFTALSALLSPLTAIGCVVTTVAMIAIGVRFLPLLIVAGLSVPMLLTGILVDRWLDKIDARGSVA